MKIIAHGNGTMICEVTMDELAKALGYSGAYTVTDKDRTFAVGKEFDLGERTGYVKDLEGFPDRVREVRKELDRMSKHLKSMETIATSAVFQVAENAKKTKQS